MLELLGRFGIDTSLLVRRDGVQTSASVLPIRPDGSRPAFHVIGANATYNAGDAPWDDIAAATHLHLGAPEFMGGEDAAADPLLRPRARRRHVGRHPRARRAGGADPRLDRPRLRASRLSAAQRRAGARRSAAQATSRRAAGRSWSAASAASPRPRGGDGASSSTADGAERVPAFADRRRRHDRLRRLVLGRLPARPLARAQPPRRRRSRLRRRRARRPGPWHRPRRLRPRRRRRLRPGSPELAGSRALSSGDRSSRTSAELCSVREGAAHRC